MRSLARIVFVLISICIVEIALNSTVFAGPIIFNGPLTYTVNATIEPTVHIIVDPSFNIIKIISNSVTPSVIDINLESLNGPVVALNGKILGEYNHLTNFGKRCRPGIVYDKTVEFSAITDSHSKMDIANLFPLNSFFKLNFTARILLYS